MNIKHLLKFKKIILFSVIVILICVSAFFVLNKKKDKIIKIEFLSVDEKIADSILQKLSIEEKIKQILFINEAFSQGNNTGGKIFDSLALSKLFYIKNTKIDTFSLNPFVLYKSNIFLPNFSGSKILNPSSLLLVGDTAFSSKYIDFCFELDSALKRDFIYVPFSNNIKNNSLKDTLEFNFYKNLTLKFVEKYSQNKILLGIPFIDYSAQDSMSQKKWDEYYNKLFQQGVNFVITENIKASMFIKKKGFRGIIITKMDDPKNIDAFFNSSAEMIFSDDLYEQFFSLIVNKCKRRKKFQKMLDQKVKKIIMAKIWLEQNKKNQFDTVEIKNIQRNKKIEVINRNIYKKSIVTVNNADKFLPITNLNLFFSIYKISNKNDFENFEEGLKNYISFTSKNLKFNEDNIIGKIKIPSSGNLIFVFDSIPNKAVISYLKSLDSTKKIVIVYFGDINDLVYFKKFKHLVFSSENNELSHFYTAQLIFGGISSVGKIPEFLSKKIKINRGEFFDKIRLGYDIPEMVGLKTEVLKKIDSIANFGVSNGAFPGCQIFVAKNGTVVWNSSYGYLTYAKRTKVSNNVIYDLASVTKIASTTLAAMKMYEQGKLALDVSIGKYFKNTKIDYDRIKPDTTIFVDTLNINEVKNWQKKIKGTDTIWLNDSMVVSYDSVIYTLTPKNNIFKVTPRQLLMHKSGVQPAMPILRHLLILSKKFIRISDLYEKYDKDTIIGRIKKLRKKIYSSKYITDSAQIQVAQSMYLKTEFFDTLWKDTKQLPVTKKKNYVYSDVNMILLQLAIDSINRYSISRYVQNNFYKRLFLSKITFLPLRKFGKSRIAPTENDKFWRRQLVWGYVHDPSAAIMGQIAGNAGLFSNAFSLGVIGQLLLNGGKYGGATFLSKKTIDKFTQTQEDSHRGLGFDKWSKRQIIAKDASPNTYGHTGFTGTCIWIDPDNQIVFVFLSNRVNPNVKNWRINKYKIRQKVHQTVYDAMK